LLDKVVKEEIETNFKDKKEEEIHKKKIKRMLKKIED